VNGATFGQYLRTEIVSRATLENLETNVKKAGFTRQNLLKNQQIKVIITRKIY